MCGHTPTANVGREAVVAQGQAAPPAASPSCGSYNGGGGYGTWQQGTRSAMCVVVNKGNNDGHRRKGTRPQTHTRARAHTHTHTHLLRKLNRRALHVPPHLRGRHDRRSLLDDLLVPPLHRAVSPVQGNRLIKVARNTHHMHACAHAG